MSHSGAGVLQLFLPWPLLSPGFFTVACIGLAIFSTWVVKQCFGEMLNLKPPDGLQSKLS